MKYKIKHIEVLKKLEIPASEFSLAGTAFLSVFGIRENNDLDVIVSRKIRNSLFPLRTGTINFPDEKNKVLSIYPTYSPRDCNKCYKTRCLTNFYVELAKVNNEDFLIYNRSIKMNGFNFLEPRLIILMKMKRNKSKDKKDILLFRKFILFEKYKQFCDCTDYQIGVDLFKR